ncbi:MAG: M3 family metallopeptidase [Polaromonas sp.]
MTTTNPLLDFSDVPLFDRIQPEHVSPAVDALLVDAQAALGKVTASDFPADWSGISAVLDVATEKLGRAWGAVSHLNAVADTPELRAAYNAALPVITEFYTRLGADEALYAKYKAIDVNTLNTEQKQAHKNAMRNFVLSGAELVGAAKERFAKIQERQAELSQKFSENALDATDAFAYYATESELTGVPADVIETAREQAKAEGKDGYKLTLKMPSYLPVMQFAISSALREVLYRAYTTRASDQAPAEFSKFDNSAVIQEILALRLEESKLLGFNNYAELSLVPKMARSSEQIINFLRDLSFKARPHAEKDLAEMRQFASIYLELSDPQAWDWTFIGEKLKEARYEFSEDEVKQYFTVPKVLDGVFKITEQLFGITIAKELAPIWNDQVEFYSIYQKGKKIASFYIDTDARSGKQSGAWMDRFVWRWKRPETNSVDLPICVLVLDWPKNATLSHRQVVDLFHELGHGLHHMLTRVDELQVSGLNGVEWDAVELPSQFMENFCWEQKILEEISSHQKTGAAIPFLLFGKMLNAKNFHSGIQTMKQIELALLDIYLHTQSDSKDMNQIVKEVRAEMATTQTPEYNRSTHSFDHIFAGGYAAGYYSYLWAEVLSSDAFHYYKQAKTESEKTTVVNLFYKNIISAGGIESVNTSYPQFRGQMASIDAFLNSRGMC